MNASQVHHVPNRSIDSFRLILLMKGIQSCAWRHATAWDKENLMINHDAQLMTNSIAT